MTGSTGPRGNGPRPRAFSHISNRSRRIHVLQHGWLKLLETSLIQAIERAAHERISRIGMRNATIFWKGA